MNTLARDWTPRLSADGVHFCSPACGGGKFCKKSDYDRAMQRATELASVMGDGWTPDVWENLGWHYAVKNKCMTISTHHYGDTCQYTASISPNVQIGTTVIQISECSSDPNDALGSQAKSVGHYPPYPSLADRSGGLTMTNHQNPPPAVNPLVSAPANPGKDALTSDNVPTVSILWAQGDDGSLRIRKWSQFPIDGGVTYSAEAQISALQERVKGLVEALKIFADEADHYDPPEGDDNQPAWSNDFPIGALRRARAALAGGERE